jgi:hypothetical protein
LPILRSVGNGLKNASGEGGILKNSENNGKHDTTTTLFATNPTRNDVGSNTNLCGERPATNRLRHGTGRNENIVMYPNKWSIKGQIMVRLAQQPFIVCG